MSTDLDARRQVCDAIDEYINDRLSAFAFDEKLFSIQTEDATVNIVRDWLWSLYDDCDDHLVVGDRDAWNAVQRLKLVLASGSTIECQRQLTWHPSQAMAALSLILISLVCLGHWTLWPIPVLMGGLVAAALGWWRERMKATFAAPDPFHMWPFSSLSEIRATLDRAAGFQKQRYRPELKHRRIRSAGVERAMHIQHSFAGMFFSPIILLLQCLPLTGREYRVVINS